jgi:carboxylesterase type B
VPIPPNASGLPFSNADTRSNRLGVLGLLPPASTDKKDTNLSVGDLINSLEFLKKIVPSLGGDPKKVVIAGQSSGAGMIRGELRLRVQG